MKPLSRPVQHHPRKSRGGRPSKWNDGKTLVRLLDALRDPAYQTKALACRAAGLGYSTFARWQAEYPILEKVWERARHARWDLRQQARAARQRSRPRPPAPTKQMRMVCWFLVFRVHPEEPLSLAHERRACERVRLSVESWHAAKAQFPRLMANVHAKRARRLAYLREHGTIDLNWCPPDPKRRFPPVYPAFAQFHWQRGRHEGKQGGGGQRQSPRTGRRWL